MKRTASVTAVAAQRTTVWQAAGNPGAGTLAIGNTANGVVPTDAVAGYPPINAFGGGAKGLISRIEWGNSVASRIQLFDRLFAAGAYAFNANVTLASQPSFASRVPGGNDYKGLLLYIEAVTAFTGNPSFQIAYLDQDGNAGNTGVVASGAALIVGRGLFLPLAAGDSGIQQITQVICTVASAGTFNVSILRPLGASRGNIANWQDVQDFFSTGGPEVFADSALYPIVTPDSTATGLPSIVLDIANG
jgi:hypothetical protein